MDSGDCPNGATPTQFTCARAKATLGRYGTQGWLRWGFLARACGNPSGGAICGSLAESSIIPDADNAGAGLVEKLASTCPDHLRGQVYVLCLPEGVKDANELWQQLDADAEGKTTRTSAVLWRG